MTPEHYLLAFGAALGMMSQNHQRHYPSLWQGKEPQEDTRWILDLLYS